MTPTIEYPPRRQPHRFSVRMADILAIGIVAGLIAGIYIMAVTG